MKKAYSIFFLIFYTSFCYSQVLIPLEKENGVYKIPCKVNDLSLKFIFDTGASDVVISLSEAIFMVKNGYLLKGDILGNEYYQIADGTVAEGTKIILRKIEIGGVILSNVPASIVHSNHAPLLLGQSAMEKFGKFSFDYKNNILKIGDGPEKVVEKIKTDSIDNISKAELLRIYPKGITEIKSYNNGLVSITKIKIVDNNVWIYRHETYGWGGQSFFKDNKPITEAMYISETSK